jgi:hypothetical protein
MRLATYNVENMFERPVAMDLHTWEEGRQALQDFTRLSNLIQKQQYSQQDKEEMITRMKRYKGLLTKGSSNFILLNEVRERLLKKGSSPKIVANGRDDWKVEWWVSLIIAPM